MSEAELRQRVQTWLSLVPVTGAGLAPAQPMLDRDFVPGKSPQADTPYTLAFSRSETPYRIWNLVRAWAESRGYAFNYAGDMGSMGRAITAQHTHQPDEPVTMLSLWDAMVWCNALSELLGRQPAYTTDAAGTEVFRQAPLFRLEMYRGLEAPHYAFRTNLPKHWTIHTGAYKPIYLHAAADGFRLPLPAEWQAANQPSSRHGFPGRGVAGRQQPGPDPTGGNQTRQRGGTSATWRATWQNWRGAIRRQALTACRAVSADTSTAITARAIPRLMPGNRPPWDAPMWDSAWLPASREQEALAADGQPRPDSGLAITRTRHPPPRLARGAGVQHTEPPVVFRLRKGAPQIARFQQFAGSAGPARRTPPEIPSLGIHTTNQGKPRPVRREHDTISPST
jgi:hypothetical protein